MTLFEAKKYTVQKIKNVSETSALDAEVLLQNILGRDKTFILLNKDFVLTAAQEECLEEWTARRAQGLPVAYITGKKEFYGYEFSVTPDVLIPKPDTEILVERAVEILSQKDEDTLEHSVCCDMCTGSGCIGISILRALLDKKNIPAKKLPLFILADISAPALEIAEKNAHSLLSEEEGFHVQFVQSDLFGAFETKKVLPRSFFNNLLFRSRARPPYFDMIVSNPPYIPRAMVDELLRDGRSEPRLALEGGGSDGLDIPRRIIEQAKNYLSKESVFLMETGEYNACGAARFMEQNGFSDIKIHRDLEGQKRVVEACIK